MLSTQRVREHRPQHIMWHKRARSSLPYQASNLQRHDIHQLTCLEVQWNVRLGSLFSFHEIIFGRSLVLEYQMSKRKRAKASKHDRNPKIATKAHRVTQAVVKSPRERSLRSVARSTERSPAHRKDSNQEAALVEEPRTVFENDCKQTMTDNGSKKGLDFSPMAEETFEAPRIAREQQVRGAAFAVNTIRPMLNFQMSLLRLWANNIEAFLRNYERGVETLDSRQPSHEQRAA
jgi:hypothetical protein